MKKTTCKAGLILCLIISGVIFTGCSEEDVIKYDATEEAIEATWQDMQTGFSTILKSDGTYSVSLGSTVWQTGTWTTQGSNITFYPQGDDSATMQYSLSEDGNTMTITDDGEVTVLTKQ